MRPRPVAACIIVFSALIALIHICHPAHAETGVAAAKDDVLAHALAHAACTASSPFIIFTSSSNGTPRRRGENEPAVVAAAALHLLPATHHDQQQQAAAVAQAAAALTNSVLLAAEGAALFGGRRSHAFTLAFADVRGANARCFSREASVSRAPPRFGPFAAFDAASATLYIDLSLLPSIAATALSTVPSAADGIKRLAGAAVGALAKPARDAAAAAAAAAAAGTNGAPAPALAAAVGALAAGAAAHVPAALRAAGRGGGGGGAGIVSGPVPLWYCIACVAALGLLAPLVINYALGEAAQAACAALSLDTPACLDLFVGALAVGLVLSLLAAVPIFKACRLAECAARPLPPPPPALAVA